MIDNSTLTDLREFMRRTSVFALSVLLSGFLLAFPVHAQQGLDDLSDLGNTLQTISGEYADSYVQPLTNTFGAGTNAALFRSADVGNSLIPGFPLDAYLGVSVTGPFTSSMKTSFQPFGDGQTSFGENDQFTISHRERDDLTSPIATNKVPTVFGETDPPGSFLIVSAMRDINQDGTEEQIKIASAKAPQGLADTPIAPLIIPQLAVGSVFGTDVQLRYFPKSKLGISGSSYGRVSVFGLAVRHDIDQWFPAPLPLNLALQGAWNQFSLENDVTIAGETQTSEVLDASGWAFNLQASKGLPVAPITFYGGLQYETFSVDYNYTFPLQDVGGVDVDDVNVSLSQKANNTFRGLVGVTFTAAVVRINVDYAVGNAQNVVTAGFGVRL